MGGVSASGGQTNGAQELTQEQIDQFTSQATDRALVMSVVCMLQTETGQADPAMDRAGQWMQTTWDAINRTTGIPLETLRAEAAGGVTLSSILGVHDGDLEAVRTAIKEAFADTGLASEELDQRIESLLNGSLTPLNPDGTPPAAASQR